MDVTTSIFSIIILIISVVLHEVAHGTVADMLGDPTARLAGRLTLNPLSHMELVGSFLLPLACLLSGTGFIIGWAKPVPFNNRLLKYHRWGPALVACAGPLINIVLAVGAALIYRVLANHGGSPASVLVASIVLVNVSLAVFNLLPLPPLDGHHILGAIFPRYGVWARSLLERYQFVILIAVIFFAGSIISPIVSLISRFLLF